ncbi:MAG TPA: methyltransferase [Vicinamibacterales bacterium]|nr:methyltransferase [Vicinamibacterales bacterium]
MPSTVSVTPERIMAVANGHWATQILSTAAHFRFFTLIAQGHRTADALATAAGVNRHGARVLLDAAAALGFLTKHGDEYALAPDAEAFLVEDRPGNMAAMLAELPNLTWSEWRHLRDAVRTGRAVVDSQSTANAEAFFGQLIRLIAPQSAGPADAVAERLARKGLRVIDVGAGNAVWSIPFARREAEVTAFDLPKVLKETDAIVREAGLSDRCRFVPGDLTSADFGSAAYDVAILGNICHGLSAEANRDLFTRLRRALTPAGRLVIADMVPDEQRTSPVFPVLFAVNMLLMEGTDTYTRSQYESWLREAGLGRIEFFDTHRWHSPVIIASNQ